MARLKPANNTLEKTEETINSKMLSRQKFQNGISLFFFKNEIKNADKDYQLKNGATRKFTPFKKIDVGDVDTYTLTLTEEED